MRNARIAVSPSAFGVALDAQIIGGFKRHHIGFVAGAAGLVAAQAFHGEVLIPRINDFFSNRVGGMGLPLVAFAANFITY